MKKMYVYWNKLERGYIRDTAYEGYDGHKGGFTKDINTAQLFEESEIRNYPNFNDFKPLTKVEYYEWIANASAWQEYMKWLTEDYKVEIIQKQDMIEEIKQEIVKKQEDLLIIEKNLKVLKSSAWQDDLECWIKNELSRWNYEKEV